MRSCVVKPEEGDTNAKDEDDSDADIKYPTDLDLLNESRQKEEELIDELCLTLGVQELVRGYHSWHEPD